MNDEETPNPAWVDGPVDDMKQTVMAETTVTFTPAGPPWPGVPLEPAPTGAAGLPRYRPAMVPHSPVLAAQMVADTDGEWVRRADVLALLGSERASII